MKNKVKITPRPGTQRVLSLGGGQSITAIDADYMPFDDLVGGPLTGINWKLEGDIDWRAEMRRVGFTQDPTTKLCTVSAAIFGTNCTEFADANGNCICDVFPDTDTARTKEELHIVCGPRERLMAFRKICEPGTTPVDITRA